MLSVNVGKHQHSVCVCVRAGAFVCNTHFALVIILHRIFNHISLVKDACESRIGMSERAIASR